MKKLLYLFFLISITSTPYASNNAGAFLEKSVGPRPASLGLAYSAAANDTYSIYLNPAGLTHVQRRQWSLHHYRAFETSYFGTQGTFKWKSLYFGLGLIRANVNDIDEVIRNDEGTLQKTGTSFSYHAMALYFSGAKPLSEKIHMGASLKYIQETLFKASGKGIGLDLGIQYQVLEWLKLGSSVQNIMPTKIRWDNSYDTIPRTIRLGSLVHVTPELNLSFDAKKRQGRALTYHLGTEYFITPHFPVRLGLDDREFSIGTGLYFSPFSFDFSYTVLDDFVKEDIYRFGLTYFFQKQVPQTKMSSLPHYTEPVRDDLPELESPDPTLMVELDEITKIRKTRRVIGVSGFIENVDKLTINDKYVFIRPDKKFYQVVTLPTDDTFILKFEGIGPSKKEISVIKYFIRE